MSPRIPRLVLHAGLHRTATTTVQVGLEVLRRQLRKQGVALVNHRQIKRLQHLSGWASGLKPEPAHAQHFSDELRSLVLDEMSKVEKVSGRPAHQVLISSERLGGARLPTRLDSPVFRPRAVPAIDHVLKALEPEEAHIALYVRRQDRFMESCYIWEIQKGLTHTIRDQFPFIAEPVMDYTELADRLVAIPGVTSIRVRPFETIRSGSLAYLDDFLTNVGLQGTLDYSTFSAHGSEENPGKVIARIAGRHLETPQQAAAFEAMVSKVLTDNVRMYKGPFLGHSNSSYSQPALDIALQANHLLTSPAQRTALGRLLLDQFPAGAYPPATVLSPEDREAIIDLYRPVNERLFETRIPGFPVDSYSTEDGVRSLA